MKDFAVFCPTPSRKSEVHSKTGRTFKVDENRIRPVAAVGRPIIDLTDPITGKVIERVDGENHVFTDSLFSYHHNYYEYARWTDMLSQVMCCLNDSVMPIDPAVPYLFGQTIGYGRPNTSGTGTRRGAYNATNQVLNQVTPDSVRWLFQYDFTSAQCNGEAIGTVGLTFQYLTTYPRITCDGYKVPHISAAEGRTCDGRYAYSCSTAGVVTRHDLWSGSSSVIADVSSITGTTSDTKIVGYAPATGKYYIYVYSGTAGNRKMYEFSDSTFGTLLNTYNVSNFLATQNAMYIYGNKAFFPSTSNDSRIYSGDFVDNTYNSAGVQYTSYNYASYQESTSTSAAYPAYGSCAYGDRYILCGGGTYSSSHRKSFLFDASTESIAAYMCSLSTSSNTNMCLHPITTEKLLCSTRDDNQQNFTHRAAIAAKKLDTPVTKTSANGMTVTYELEVFWE